LQDGSVLRGESVGVAGSASGEVVFNTALTGYQEILTDPSYCRQLVTLTYPHIGNVGANRLDEESDRVHAAGLLIRDLPSAHSSWRAEESLDSYLDRRQVVAIAGIDTRRLTRLIREGGAQGGCLVAGPEAQDEQAALDQARSFPGLQGMDLARVVTTDTAYAWQDGSWVAPGTRAPHKPTTRWKVVAYDFGIKRNILRMLVDRGCEVTIVPATTPAEDVIARAPHGVFLSNGPGDPEPCDYAIAAIGELLEQNVVLFGICLGHQLLALAGGARTTKMKFGHHGANHPVKALDSETVLITSQNHGFAVDEGSLPPNLRATHRSLFDGSLQGVEFVDRPAFGFQGHPEASPGPHDVAPLFDRFIEAMSAHRSSSRCVAASGP
jgi:carbamoyl-phosphate synthase small subunit